MKVILLDYGRVVAPEDGAPVIRSVYGTPDDDEESYKLFGSLRHDLAKGIVTEDDIKNILLNKGYVIPGDYGERWQATLQNHLAPTADMLALVDTLKQQYVVALLSNVWPLSAKIIRENGWYSHFDQLFLSCEMGMAKPDTEIYDAALEQLNVPANEILFVDDKQANLEYPNKIGFQTMQVSDPADAVRKITQYLDL